MTPSDDRMTSELPVAAPALDDWFAADGLPDDATDGWADDATDGWTDDGATDAGQPAEGSEDALDRDELLLASPPSNISPDELDAALASPPPSARSLRATKVLGLGLVVALTFVGGIALGQRTAPSAAAGPGGAGQFSRALGQGFPGGFPTDAPAGQTGGEQGAAAQDGAPGSVTATASTATGTVRLIDGSVIYLADADGNLTRVEVDSDTDITTSSTADLDDIDTGDTVTVTGTTTTDGMAASTVTVAP